MAMLLASSHKHSELISIEAMAVGRCEEQRKNGFAETQRLRKELHALQEISTLSAAADVRRIGIKINRLNPELPASVTNRYASLIDKCVDEHRLDEDTVIAMMKLESNFDYKAVSVTGARGLMQIIPGIWCKYLKITPEDLFNPAINVYAGCWILNHYKTRYKRTYLERYGGTPQPESGAYESMLQPYLAKIKWLPSNY
jgi:soluble lytic murein transglycosylase-like protein